ncbi:hypothetical protein, partial [Vibrio vulnificus]|uniref:hypothetical protein n=1 Tax=Vibrio vulnificus TaxID=672 RepID=UPI0019D47B7F
TVSKCACRRCSRAILCAYSLVGKFIKSLSDALRKGAVGTLKAYQTNGGRRTPSLENFIDSHGVEHIHSQEIDI